MTRPPRGGVNNSPSVENGGRPGRSLEDTGATHQSDYARSAVGLLNFVVAVLRVFPLLPRVRR